MMCCRLFRFALTPVLLAVSITLAAQKPETPEPVPMPSTELRIFHSEIMDQEMRIHVQLPLNYAGDGSRTYPVWYMTDANRYFPMVANISTLLGFPPGSFPQMIVVGIGYEIQSMADWAAWRTRDLTPVRHEPTEDHWTQLLHGMTGDTTLQAETGEAKKFLGFICEELIPLIESEYPVTEDERTLGGYSYGGLFALFSMFERPGTFSRYYCGSPSIHYANRVMFEVEKTFSENHTDLPARLFLSAGGLETELLPDLMELTKRLKSRQYPHLQLGLHVFEEEGHASAAPASMIKGFQELYGEE